MLGDRNQTHTPYSQDARIHHIFEMQALKSYIDEIVTFAGRRSIQTTTLRVHVSDLDFANKLAREMAEIHVH